MRSLQELMNERARKAQTFQSLTRTSPEELKRANIRRDINNIDRGIRQARLKSIAPVIGGAKSVFKQLANFSIGVHQGLSDYQKQQRRR
jgi:hypothetical protein